jgi:hypothetical protein
MADDLDPTVAEQILGEYPELLDHWQQEMEHPDPVDPYRIGAKRLMHDPVYLGEVARQHRWLTDEAAGRPDEKLARRCDKIVATFPPVRDERKEQLTDPWIRAYVGPEKIAKLYDPEYLQRWVRIRRKGADPFSKENLRIEQFIALASAGGTITVTDIATGEVTDEWEVGPQPGDRPLS